MTPLPIGGLLSTFLAEQAGAKFSWRNANCGHFVGAWLLLAERVDYVQQLTFSMPRNAVSAARLAEKRGGLHTVVSEAIRRPVMLGALAQVGDIVLLNQNTGGAGVLAICNGRYAMARSLEAGIVSIDMSFGKYAWRLDRYVE